MRTNSLREAEERREARIVAAAPKMDTVYDAHDENFVVTHTFSARELADQALAAGAIKGWSSRQVPANSGMTEDF